MGESEVIEEITKYIDVTLDKERSNDDILVYSLGGQVMAVLKLGSRPINLSLRCDRNLAKSLKDRYESVLNPSHLNSNKFITILLVGQLSDQDIKDLIRQAYEQTKKFLLLNKGN